MALSKSLAKPYAKALFELAADKVQRGLWLHRLQVLDKVFQDAEVRAAVDRLPPTQALDWVKSAVGAGLDTEAYALLALLLENRRLDSLGDIRQHFGDLMVKLHGFGVLQVTTAVSLTDKEREASLAAFQKIFQQNLIPHYHVDASIRGGVVGQVDDLVYDGSLRGSLDKLRKNLIS